MTTLALDPLLNQYLAAHPAELGRLRPFVQFMAANEADQRLDRTNFKGHITASGLVIQPRQKRMLAIHHISLDRWLQPGGHVEPGDSTLIESACREILEETGIPPASLALIPAGSDASVPFDIDSHAIPARPSRQEPGHTHHDWRYLFELKGDPNLKPQSFEIKAAQWLSPSQFDQGAGLRIVLEKIERYWSR